MQVTAAGAEELGNEASALLAASQASTQLKASLLQEQQIVSTFLHHFCEKVCGLPALAIPLSCCSPSITILWPHVALLVGMVDIHVAVWVP